MAVFKKKLFIIQIILEFIIPARSKVWKNLTDKIIKSIGFSQLKKFKVVEN